MIIPLILAFNMYVIYSHFAGNKKVTTPKYTGKTVDEAVNSVASKFRKPLITDQLATTPDPKECIACRTVRCFSFFTYWWKNILLKLVIKDMYPSEIIYVCMIVACFSIDNFYYGWVLMYSIPPFPTGMGQSGCWLVFIYFSKQLKDLVANFRGTLSEKSLGTQGSAIAFTRLLRKVRESDQATIQAVLKDKKNARIL